MRLQWNSKITYTAIDVQNKVVFLGGGNGLNSDSVVEKLMSWEVLGDEFLDKFHSEIRVVARLDTVTNSGNYD